MSKEGKIVMQPARGYWKSGPKKSKSKPVVIGFKKLKHKGIK